MNILDHIGNTPLLKLRRVIESPDVEIYVKCEFMNPGGSIKDRMALRMIEEAEKSGQLKLGGTIAVASSWLVVSTHIGPSFCVAIPNR